MPLGGSLGGGGKVGTGYVKIKPDAEGFGSELDRTVGAEAESRSGLIGGRASMAFKGAFLAGTATMAKGVLDFGAFDAGMREVFTLMPDISEQAMGEMTADVKGFASEFGVLPDEVIPSLYNSISAGIPPDNVFAFLEQSQKLAKGGATDLATAVDGLSSVVNAYGPEVLDAASASDSLFTAVKLGKTTVDEMSGSLFNVAPIAAQFGVSFDEVAASIATVTAQGTPTSVATTQMASALAELGKDGTKTSKAFQEIAGKTFPQFVAEGGTMTDALSMLSEHADDTGMSIVDMFGSKEAGLFAAGLVKDLDKTNSNLLAVGDAAGATDKAFGTMNEGLAATMDRLKAKFSVILIDLGESLAPTIETIGTGIAGLLEIFMALPEPMRTGIVLFGTLAAGALAFAGPMLKLIKLGKALSGVFSLLAANPWMLAILALAAGAYLVIKNWDEVKAFLGAVWEWIEDTAGAIGEFFVDLWEDVSGAVVAAWEGIVDGVTAALDAVTGAVSAAWDAVTGATVAAWDAITGAIVTAWEAITDAITTAVDAVAGVIEAGFEAISWVITTHIEVYRTVIETGWNTIRTVVETAIGAISAVVSTGFETVRGIVDTVSNTIRTVVETAWNAASAAVGGAVGGIQVWVDGLLGIPDRIGGAFSTLASIISTPFTVAFDAIKSAWNSTVGGYGFDAPGWIPGIGGKGFHIPSMAQGGIAADPMLALVGDAGPRNQEIITPENLMRQVVGDALRSNPGSGLTVETHLHVDQGIDDARFAAMLEKASVEIVRVVNRQLDRTGQGYGQTRAALGGAR